MPASLGRGWPASHRVHHTGVPNQFVSKLRPNACVRPVLLVRDIRRRPCVSSFQEVEKRLEQMRILKAEPGLRLLQQIYRSQVQAREQVRAMRAELLATRMQAASMIQRRIRGMLTRRLNLIQEMKYERCAPHLQRLFRRWSARKYRLQAIQVCVCVCVCVCLDRCPRLDCRPFVTYIMCVCVCVCVRVAAGVCDIFFFWNDDWEALEKLRVQSCQGAERE